MIDVVRQSRSRVKSGVTVSIATRFFTEIKINVSYLVSKVNPQRKGGVFFFYNKSDSIAHHQQ